MYVGHDEHAMTMHVVFPARPQRGFPKKEAQIRERKKKRKREGGKERKIGLRERVREFLLGKNPSLLLSIRSVKSWWFSQVLYSGSTAL